MDITDTRLGENEKLVLYRMIGHTLESYVLIEFPDTSITYKSVWLSSDEKTIEIRNGIESLNYMGDIEDVAVLSVLESSPEQIVSSIGGIAPCIIEINRTVVDILLYEDVHTCSEHGKDIYGYAFTAAVVFVLDETELVFEKPVWFSETLQILRGPGATKHVYSPEEMLEESLDPDFAYRVERKVTSLREWAEQGSPE